MTTRPLRREKLLLTYKISHVQDERYADLLEPDTTLELFLTNMRNRSLLAVSIDSMTKSVLSLYHSLLTGSKEFPVIEADVHMNLMFVNTLDEQLKQPNWENAPPTGMLPPARGVRTRKIFTPAIPEEADMEVLKGDRRNCIRTMEFRFGNVYTRVISPVYRSQDRELPNRWRVTDYDTSGKLVMSTLCQFKRCSVQLAKSKRKREEDCSTTTSSSSSPPKKRARV
ncbi:uncharacterized protein LOC125011368 [Mugil cephalus]|uniref:uncharacterized protein LOC125010665 n=1 Tax=Mugil cephalus TaxID=48193 RepID=UPI001FB64A20|nr:uncharacterized protein LOC125010665 [Mugil cephalus]XP_047446508.1 uncharacterized protein LOC125011368 [Mugil cephalus]